MKIIFQVNTNNRNIARLEKRLKSNAIEDLNKKYADKLIKEMKRLITTGTRTGNKYGDHIASAPGEPPANWHGGLVDSMKANRNNATEYVVEFTVPYAKDLEKGEGSVKGKPRPFVQPSVDKLLPQFEKEVADIFKRFL